MLLLFYAILHSQDSYIFLYITIVHFKITVITVLYCFLNMTKYIYLISYGWTFVFSPVWSLNIRAHFSWYTLAYISIWYDTGVECGMVNHRACISATLVDDVELFPTVALQIYIPAIFCLHSALSVFSMWVRLMVVYRFSAFPFDFCSMTLFFQKSLYLGHNYKHTYSLLLGLGINNIGDVYVFYISSYRGKCSSGNYSIFL